MISEVLQIVSVCITTFVAAFALYSIRRKPKWIDDLIEDASETLFKPGDEGVSVFDSLVDRFSQKFSQGLRMSFLAGKSGEVRHNKAIEKRVFEAVKNKSPELQLAMTTLKKLGLEDLATPENFPALLQIAEKYGLFNYIKGQSPNNSGPRYGEM